MKRSRLSPAASATSRAPGEARAPLGVAAATRPGAPPPVSSTLHRSKRPSWHVMRQIVELSGVLGDVRDQNQILEGENRDIRERLQSQEEQLREVSQQLLGCQEELGHLKEEVLKELNLWLQEAIEEGEMREWELEERLRGTEAALGEALRQLRQQGQSLDLQGQRISHLETERKNLHNTLMELKGNIRVFCRVRPVLPEEGGAQGPLDHLHFPPQDPKTLVLCMSEEEHSRSLPGFFPWMWSWNTPWLRDERSFCAVCPAAQVPPKSP